MSWEGIVHILAELERCEEIECGEEIASIGSKKSTMAVGVI
jgi:hypothetical protein